MTSIDVPVRPVYVNALTGMAQNLLHRIEPQMAAFGEKLQRILEHLEPGAEGYCALPNFEAFGTVDLEDT